MEFDPIDKAHIRPTFFPWTTAMSSMSVRSPIRFVLCQSGVRPSRGGYYVDAYRVENLCSSLQWFNEVDLQRFDFAKILPWIMMVCFTRLVSTSPNRLQVLFHIPFLSLDHVVASKTRVLHDYLMQYWSVSYHICPKHNRDLRPSAVLAAMFCRKLPNICRDKMMAWSVMPKHVKLCTLHSCYSFLKLKKIFLKL